MLAIQLNPLAAAKLVDLETIGQLHRGAVTERRAVGISECDSLDRRQAAARKLKIHLHVFAADDFGIDHRELAVEYRLGKSLAPGSPAAQRMRAVSMHSSSALKAPSE